MKAENGVVKSVGRVFAILEAFARVQQSMTAIEIGRRLGTPPSSTAAILKSMVTLGYLSFDRVTRVYLPTIRLGMLTHWVDGASLGSAALDRLIEALHETTGETIIIATQSDLEMKYLLTRPGRFPIRFLAPTGLRRPLCGSGTGWALLASKTDAEVGALIQHVNRAMPTQPVDERRLLDLLAQVRVQGYAASYGNVISGSGVIAMVLPGGERSLVLGVGGPAERLERSEAQIVEQMRTAIARILGPPP
ncbi:MAG: IclR family transcriptional regulator [Janthinobacterium lividum]